MKLEAFQQQIFDNLTKFKGRGVVQLTGRQTGKSQINQYINQWHSMQAIQETKHEIISTAQVDGKPWHTVRCNKEVSQWLRQTYPQHEDKLWFEHIDQHWQIYKNTFDINEELYLMLVLRFGK